MDRKQGDWRQRDSLESVGGWEQGSGSERGEKGAALGDKEEGD